MGASSVILQPSVRQELSVMGEKSPKNIKKAKKQQIEKKAAAAAKAAPKQ
jgi:hypothetical protein